jgi:hypothetical protein
MTMTSKRRDYLIEMSEKTGGFVGQTLAEILRDLPVADEGEGLRIKPAKPVVLEDDRDIYGDPAPVEGDEAWMPALAEFRRVRTHGHLSDGHDLAALKAIVAKAPRA